MIGLDEKRIPTTFLVRGDAQPHVEQVTSAQILGVAVGLRRGSAEISLSAGLYDRAALEVIRAGSQIGRGIRRWAARMFDVLQSFPIYRNGVKHLIAPRLRCVIMDEEGGADSRTPVNLLQAEEGRSAVYQRHITAQLWSIPVGGVTLVAYPDNAHAVPRWWVYSLWVRRPFRRMGIGQRLTERALNHAKRLGAEAVHLYVFADNHPAIHLYECCGFVQVKPTWSAQTQSAERARGDVPFPRGSLTPPTIRNEPLCFTGAASQQHRARQGDDAVQPGIGCRPSGASKGCLNLSNPAG